MEIINKISFYLGRIIYFSLIVVAIIGAFQFYKSGERISGGAMGILVVGFATIGEFLHIPANVGSYIVGAILIVFDFLLLSRFFNYPNKMVRFLVYFVVAALAVYVLSLIFGWSINV